MKKLLVLISLLLATNTWGEAIGLNCKVKGFESKTLYEWDCSYKYEDISRKEKKLFDKNNPYGSSCNYPERNLLIHPEKKWVASDFPNMGWGESEKIYVRGTNEEEYRWRFCLYDAMTIEKADCSVAYHIARVFSINRLNLGLTESTFIGDSLTQSIERRYRGKRYWQCTKVETNELLEKHNKVLKGKKEIKDKFKL